jgi:hypothetical protein
MNIRTLLMLIILVLVSVVTYWFFTQKQESTDTITDIENQFAIKNVQDIGTIFIADRSGKEITLNRQADYWTVNEHYRARQSAVNLVLEVVENVKVRYTPPNAAVSTIVNQLATRGIKVEIYNRQDELMKAFYIGGTAADGEGTNMMLEGANTPFVTEISAFSGNLGTRFMLDLDDWRDRTLFAYAPAELQKISIEYPRQQGHSFKMEKQSDGDWKVRPYSDLVPPITDRPVSNSKINAYLLTFERNIAEDFINQHPKKDSILNLVPFAIVQTTSSTGEERSIVLHELHGTSTGRELTPDIRYAAREEGVGRYYTLRNINNEEIDFMLSQHRVIGNLLWGYSFFFDDNPNLNL